MLFSDTDLRVISIALLTNRSVSACACNATNETFHRVTVARYWKYAHLKALITLILYKNDETRRETKYICEKTVLVKKGQTLNNYT